MLSPAVQCSPTQPKRLTPVRATEKHRQGHTDMHVSSGTGRFVQGLVSIGVRVTRQSMSGYYPELLSALISLLRPSSVSTKSTRELKPPRTQPFSAALVIPTLHHKNPTRAPQLRFNTFFFFLPVLRWALATKLPVAQGRGPPCPPEARRGGRDAAESRGAAGGAADPAAAAGPRLRRREGTVIIGKVLNSASPPRRTVPAPLLFAPPVTAAKRPRKEQAHRTLLWAAEVEEM